MKIPFLKKYQPKYISDFSFDESLESLFNTMIESNNLNILLLSECGTGKTSLLYAILRQYYRDEINNNDNILFINNLKEQGIQYYRNEVKNFCQIPCSIRNKKKVIVIDDIDSINEQSQQVFRNFIDKYENNVQCLCSCVNKQKIIESLQSRLTVMKLSHLPPEKINKVIDRISAAENITITKEAQDYMISSSNSSMRVIINYMEKLSLISSDIDIHIVKNGCTNISNQDFENFVLFCKQNNRTDAIDSILNMFHLGFSVIDIYDSFFSFLKITPTINEDNKYQIIIYLCKYITIFHTVHENEIELVLFTNDLIKILSIL